MTDPDGAVEEKLDKSRRRFLIGSGVAIVGFGAATLLPKQFQKLLEAASVPTHDARTKAPERRQWVMVIDLDKCDGCGRCVEGCNKTHFVPEGQEWIKIYDVKDEFGHRYFLPRPCMQCENPPCLNVCPVGATYKRDDGVVLIDHDRCIGCRYCMAACPYDARSFNWTEPKHTPEELSHEYSPEEPWPHKAGVVEKCMFCVHLGEHGRLPACAEACKLEMGDGAIYFGDMREDVVSNGTETVSLSKLLRDRGGFRLREELGTGPRVWYLPPKRG